MKNYIVLYAEDYDCDVWEGYCCAAGVPTTAISITIKFDESDVEYEDDDDKKGEIMTTYYVMYWNDRADFPVAVFEVQAETELEAEEIAYKNGGKDYENDWPLLTETDLTEDRVKRYQNSVYTDYYIIK